MVQNLHCKCKVSTVRDLFLKGWIVGKTQFVQSPLSQPSHIGMSHFEGETPSGGGSKGLPRKLTAVGTVGEQNQLFTVYEKNWNCTDCGQENYPSRPRCFRCKKGKPEGLNNIVMDAAYEAHQAGKVNPWQEVVDPSSFQIYYYNKETGVTQWERPVEMGAAPIATGWFGRGQVGSNASQKYSDLNAKFLSRPARKQKDFVDPKKYHTEGANEYNLWYGRYMGDMNDKADREPAADRCVLEKDAGYTKADQGNAANKGRRFFCIHFAHGMCAKGSECIFHHRIPLPEDDRQCDELFDIFGRSRHSKHKDDMSGVGSFMKPCRTLFVGNLLKGQYKSPKELEEALWRHFGEWGELESLNVIHRLSIAFPRYRLRTSAEFAKEAMSNQKLDHGEVLSIRWAHDDPNPIAKEAIEKADKDAVLNLLQNKGVAVAPQAFEYPPEYQVPESKRLRIEDGAEVLEEYPELSYPNTDAQYGASGVEATAVTGASQEEIDRLSALSPAEYKAYYDNYYAQQSALNRLGLLSGASSAGAENSTVGKKRVHSDQDASTAATASSASAAHWQMYKDENSGAMYYFNSETGESTWTTPAGVTPAK